MQLYHRKMLAFESYHWNIDNFYPYYVCRLPGTDNILIHTYNIKVRPTSKVVSIKDFIMFLPKNKDRREAADIVFRTLEWEDNICIRKAIESNKIKYFQDSSDLRIVNGEVWDTVDYQLDRDTVRSSASDLPYESYPELPYAVLSLPPFPNPCDIPVCPLPALEFDYTTRQAADILGL